MKNLDFVSLFCGAGGLDLGLEAAGWNCTYATDVDEAAISTLNKNKGLKLDKRNTQAFNETTLEIADVRELDADKILTVSGYKKGDLPLLVGGPPCQAWSSAGHQKGFRDPRGQLFNDYIRLAKSLDARFLLLENVRGFLTARGQDGEPGSALALIREKLLSAGYHTKVCLLNSADFGVPQRRVRLFVLGFHAGDEPPFPTETHAKSADETEGLLGWVTLRQCLSQLSPLSQEEIIRPKGKLAEELAEIPAGSGVKSPGKKESTRPGGHWGYKQGAFIADLDLPARTVTASGQQDWIRDPDRGLRRLCPRECSAIQTFPKDWQWLGRNSVQYRLIGNAVPPTLAGAIGAALKEYCFSENMSDQTATISDEIQMTPLPPELQAAIDYTKREDAVNGAARRAAPSRRRSKLPTIDFHTM